MSNRVTKLLTAVILAGAPAAAFAEPRTLASGAPACGNTMGKGGYKKNACGAEELEEWRAEQAREEKKQRAAYLAQKAQARAAKAKAGAEAFAAVLATALPWEIAPKG